ncbi:MAG: SUMF1/EgtB/PvdO family nonheme iron enzyme [Planctomycetes bacterium]|nr:SUMF1/EgtB/PvdO family nonheme iron enzyme [Planctomycetota bacterium]
MTPPDFIEPFSDPSLRQGARIGPFEIREQIGAGAMGAVYRAFDHSAGREVALKLPHVDRIDPRAQERFRREGQASAALDHPGIVRIHATHSPGERPYLTYELVVDARTFDQVAPELGQWERVELLRDAARAIGHAHARGVIHRDLKDPNLLVDGEGRVRVTDFGVALLVGAERLTQTGACIGTPHTMAPEQIGGMNHLIGPATDVWALGCLLYRAVSGKHPFEGANLAELAVRVASQRLTPPSSVSEEPVPSGLDAVCRRALSKKPEERFADANAFADALDEAISNKRAARPAGPIVIVFMLLLVGLGLAAAALSSADSATPTVTLTPRAPSPAPSASPSPAPNEPTWFAALKEKPRKLPRGLVPTEVAGRFHNVRDGSLLVWIPARTFKMGVSFKGSQPSHRPEHEVTLTRGYFLGVHEVRVDQFRRFCDLGSHRRTWTRALNRKPTDDEPVTFVSWEEADAYCKWARGRLPSEAEWAHAARGGDGRMFPWGSEADASLAVCERKGQNPLFPLGVGSIPAGASPFGCLDMAGNVWEWVGDLMGPYPTKAVTDPAGPTEGLEHVVRGGSYDSKIGVCRTFKREAFPPRATLPNIGFRLCIPEPR